VPLNFHDPRLIFNPPLLSHIILFIFLNLYSKGRSSITESVNEKRKKNGSSKNVKFSNLLESHKPTKVFRKKSFECKYRFENQSIFIPKFSLWHQCIM